MSIGHTSDENTSLSIAKPITKIASVGGPLQMRYLLTTILQIFLNEFFGVVLIVLPSNSSHNLLHSVRTCQNKLFIFTEKAGLLLKESLVSHSLEPPFTTAFIHSSLGVPLHGRVL